MQPEVFDQEEPLVGADEQGPLVVGAASPSAQPGGAPGSVQPPTARRAVAALGLLLVLAAAATLSVAGPQRSLASAGSVVSLDANIVGFCCWNPDYDACDCPEEDKGTHSAAGTGDPNNFEYCKGNGHWCDYAYYS